MKKMLIISPYFPPVNAADMQRVRMSLSYFTDFGWQPEVVTVDDNYADMAKDDLLLQSVPANIAVHKVKALAKKWTSKMGLGSIALRSLWFYRQKVNALIKAQKIDLIYFSTTQFPLCILGAYWKKKFGIPYVIDMQDPWHSDYYQDKPKSQQPSKYWFSYRLNKYLEPLAIRNVDGLISVSVKYVTDLKTRYPEIANIPSATITFGAFEPDLQIAIANKNRFKTLLDPDFINIVYIGRGGADMHKAITPLFKAFAAGIQNYTRIKLYFIGTSYAASGEGQPTIAPLAKQYGIAEQVVEITDRISYYHSLLTLQQAHALFIPGSDDPAYTASKIYPYLLMLKPLLAIFNKQSPAIDSLREYGLTTVFNYDDVKQNQLSDFLNDVATGNKTTPILNPLAISKYSAQQMAAQQCALFDQVI